MRPILYAVIVATCFSSGCMSERTVRESSDEKICFARLNFSARSEATRRGLNCDEINRARQRRQDAEFYEMLERNGGADKVLRDLQAIQQYENMERSNAANQAQQMTVLCGYCAKIYPQEAFGRCKGITQYSCGALWDNGRKNSSGGSGLPRRLDCSKVGSFVECVER